ncbi:MAG: DEAD/DEAH box helicase [Deltaproteobacteria bacterium]|nr:DEAD/DEAH box helicase [Deltaproteobacteria bacterium]
MNRPAPFASELLAVAPLGALVTELGRFPTYVSDRGRVYAAGGHVGALTFDSLRVHAKVRGTGAYDTQWSWHAGHWLPSCSCPVGPYCKHAYALGCCVLAHDDAAINRRDPRLARLLPPRVMSQPALLDLPAASARRAPEQRLSEQRTPGLATLQRLRTATEPWSRKQYVQQLLGRMSLDLDLYGEPFTGILSESDPDLLCWRLAAEIKARGGGWLPPALEPFRDRPELSARRADRTRSELADLVVAWAAQRRKNSQRSLRLIFGLRARAGGDAGVSVEARVTTPRLFDEPRTMQQLQQLCTQQRRSADLFAPEEAALLDWLVTSGVGGSDNFYAWPYGGGYEGSRYLRGAELRSLLLRLSANAHAGESAMAVWSDKLDQQLAARAGVIPNGPVRLRTDPARLLPMLVARGDSLYLDLRFLWPDGEQRSFDEVVYVDGSSEAGQWQPNLVLAAGEFSLLLEEPPEPVLERFRAVGGLALPPAERAQLIGLLASRFPHLAEALGPHTRLHEVRTAVTLDLRDDDWLQLRLLAYTGDWQPGTAPQDGVIVFEYSPERGWLRQNETAADPEYGAITGEGPEPSPAGGDLVAPEAAPEPRTLSIPMPDTDIWIEAPQPEAVQPVTAWLEQTEAASGLKRGPGGYEPVWPDRNVGWWLRASARRMAGFAEAWAQRPPGAAYFGTERIRRLLSGRARVTPRVRITASGIDWFSVSAEWQSEGLRLSDADLAKLRSAKAAFVKLPSGWVHRDVAAVHEEAMAVFADLGLEPGQGEQRLTMWQLAAAKTESLAALERMGADESAVRAVEELRQRVASFTGLPRIAPPAGLTATLRPYQQAGLDFLAYTSSIGIGAVLADDMGLGKTVQALAWLEHLRTTEPDDGPSLVVCPASVVHNWAREAQAFTPGLRVLLLTRGNERHELRREIPEHDLIVTNYALLRRDIEALRELEWRAAILDEAQNIKNPDAVVTKAALELQARHRLALTGTPLENRALDLWSIISFVNPGYLGSRLQFGARFDRPDAPPHARTLLAAKLRPILLRRMKREVATDLPERIEERRDCELTPGQRQLYLAELQRSRALVETLSAAPGGIKQNKIVILAALTRLRQICCHPALAGGKSSLGSGKFDALFELLEPLLAEGHKVLLFSQFVQCLKLLSAAMAKRTITHHLLTGESVKREQIVAAFQDDPDPCVFLISLKAGGTGLNLTAASYVVLFDPWWNPAVEAQAIDRTHRIGQDRTVIAYRMLAEGTLEEKIWELQQRKAALARDILGEDGFARSLTREDLNFLLTET